MNTRSICFSALAVLLLGVCSQARGQGADSEVPPCTQAEARQFDFWIGDWDIEAKRRPPGGGQWVPNEVWVGTRVRPDLGNCVLIEESLDINGADTLVVGMSLTSYNVHLGKYQQLWADRKGNALEHVGALEDGRMVLYLEPTASDGEALTALKPTTLIRMVFEDIEADRLVWRYEYSVDEGHTWTGTSEAIYTRRK